MQPLSRVRLHEQIVQRLREHVEANDLGPGDRLPSERQLSEWLGVSRASVKQALLVLELQGLAEVRHGEGTFLREPTLEAGSIEDLLDRRRRLPEVLDAREALETQMALLAAERRDEDDLRALDDALEAMAAEVGRGDLGEEGDRAFHDAVARAARSEMLRDLLGSIAERVSESRRESLRQPGRGPLSLAQHRAIAEAIRHRDGPAAHEAMREHLRTVSDVRLLSWTPDDVS